MNRAMGIQVDALRLTFAVVVLLGATAVPASTVYHDNFTNAGTDRGGPYTSSLAGTAPTTDNNGGGNTWTFAVETGGWGQTGSGYATPTSSNYLPFVPVAGYVYTLSATIDTSGWSTNSASWFTIGFTSTPNNWPVTGVYDLSENGLNRSGEPSTVHTVVLDTTAPGWTNTQGLAYVGWFTDLAGSANLNPSVVEVTISNFSLTAVSAIPAPAALPAGAVLLSLVTLRRRSV